MGIKKHNINIKDGKTKNQDESAFENGMSDGVDSGDVEKEISTIESEVAKLKEMLLRKAAEFDNYKKRTEAELSNYIKYASENLIKELLPVYDDFGRSVESVDKGETKDFETLKKGLHHIYDKFKKILEKEGLREINSAGKEFDVEVNSALMQIPRNDVKPNTVLEVVEKGYKLKDKVIKHEKVLVSSEPEKN